MPGSKRPVQNDTLTFLSEEMTYEDVRNIFQRYGMIKYVNKYFSRYFVQFETPEQAKKAQSQLGRIYRVAYAHAKTNPRPRKNFRAEGEVIRISYPANLPICGYTAPRTASNGIAMIEEYVNTSARRRTSSTSSRSEVGQATENRREMARINENLREHNREFENRREKAKGSQNRREMARGSENRREMAKSSLNRRTGKRNHRGKLILTNPKPIAPKVPDPEHDDSDDSDDNTEEPEAQKPPNVDEEAEEDEYEEEEVDDDDDNEEEEEDDDDDDHDDRDHQAEARAMGASTHRRVRIEGLDEVMNELGNDMAYSVIVANIPERYTLDEVYDLVEEVKPIAFSEMDYSIKMRVKFCEVFLNDAADVDYLKQKLNDFVICGKQLTVMEPAEILDETRWNA